MTERPRNIVRLISNTHASCCHSRPFQSLPPKWTAQSHIMHKLKFYNLDLKLVQELNHALLLLSPSKRTLYPYTHQHSPYWNKSRVAHCAGYASTSTWPCMYVTACQHVYVHVHTNMTVCEYRYPFLYQDIPVAPTLPNPTTLACGIDMYATRKYSYSYYRLPSRKQGKAQCGPEWHTQLLSVTFKMQLRWPCTYRAHWDS